MTGEGDWGSEVSNGVSALPATEPLGACLTRRTDYSRAAQSRGIKTQFMIEFILFLFCMC